MKLANGAILHVRTGVDIDKVLKSMPYLAADSDGEVFAFENKPYLPKIPPEMCNSHIWDTLEGDLEYIGDVAMPKNATYEQTLATLTEF